MADEKEITVEVVETQMNEPRPRKCQAEEVVSSYMYGSAAAGLIPSPTIDLAAIGAIQLKMLHSLSKVYNVPFSKDIVKSIIAALLGSLGAVGLTRAGLASIVKLVPVIGNIASLFVLPAMAGAFTYAVGKVFVQHFEAGGTFLNFDPDSVKVYFAQQFEEGKLKINKVQSEKAAAAK